MDTVLIVADLCNPPTEKLAFHWLTTQLRWKEHVSVVFETEEYAKDIYYRFLRANGLMDGINQIVTPQEWVEAVRLDHKRISLNTIATDAILQTNCEYLFKEITGMTNRFSKIQFANQKLLYIPET